MSRRTKSSRKIIDIYRWSDFHVIYYKSFRNLKSFFKRIVSKWRNYFNSFFIRSSQIRNMIKWNKRTTIDSCSNIPSISCKNKICIRIFFIYILIYKSTSNSNDRVIYQDDCSIWCNKIWKIIYTFFLWIWKSSRSSGNVCRFLLRHCNIWMMTKAIIFLKSKIIWNFQKKKIMTTIVIVMICWISNIKLIMIIEKMTAIKKVTIFTMKYMQILMFGAMTILKKMTFG